MFRLHKTGGVLQLGGIRYLAVLDVKMLIQSTPLNVNTGEMETSPVFEHFPWTQKVKVNLNKIRTPENSNHHVIQTKCLRIFCSN